MEQITQTIENKIYGYDPEKFMPIFVDGELDNRAAFVAYKAKQFAGGVGHIAYKSFEATINVMSDLVDAANQN